MKRGKFIVLEGSDGSGKKRDIHEADLKHLYEASKLYHQTAKHEKSIFPIN
jgi:thymidylate kinase